MLYLWALPKPAFSTSSEQPLYSLEPLEIFQGSGSEPSSGVPVPHPSSTLSAGLVLVSFGVMEFTKAAFLASKLASKILSAGSLAKVGGAASSGILAGLPSLGECSRQGVVGGRLWGRQGAHRVLP